MENNTPVTVEANVVEETLVHSQENEIIVTENNPNDLLDTTGLTPEEIEKLVEQGMEMNMGDSRVQEEANVAFFKNYDYTDIFELVKNKLNGLIAGVTPESNRVDFFKNLSETIDFSVNFELNKPEETNVEYLKENLTKELQLGLKHFALFLSMESGGEGLIHHSDGLFTNLIYDIYTNKEGINTLLTNYGENTVNVENPEYRLMDGLIVNPVSIGNMLASVTLVLNKLSDIIVTERLPEGVEATDENYAKAFVDIMNNL